MFGLVGVFGLVWVVGLGWAPVSGAKAVIRSTYLASTSTSRLTGSPGARSPRVVPVSVVGIRLTPNQCSSAPGADTPVTVRETPLTVMEPFSTT